MPRLKIQPKPIDLTNPPPFATIDEVAVTLRRSRSQLTRDIRDGRFRTVKFGNSRRIETASIRDFIGEPA